MTQELRFPLSCHADTECALVFRGSRSMPFKRVFRNHRQRTKGQPAFNRTRIYHTTVVQIPTSGWLPEGQTVLLGLPFIDQKVPINPGEGRGGRRDGLDAMNETGCVERRAGSFRIEDTRC